MMQVVAALLFLTCVAATAVIPADVVRRGSATSDYGKFEVYASGKDALLYFTADDKAPVKLHVILSIPSCYCIGAADIHKTSQFDYLANTNRCYSFGIYVNDGFFQNRERCNLDTWGIQERTELAFNPIGSPATPGIRRASWGDNITEEWVKEMFAPKPKIWERVEGAVLAMSIRDYFEHSHVTSRKAAIFNREAPGGFLFMQGTVMVRPCRLQWYMPFIFSPPGGEHRLMQFTLPYDARSTGTPEYYSEEDAILLNAIFNQMRAKNIITDAHLGNLGLNNILTSNVRAFEFSAVFVPFRRSEEFLRLVEPFAYTALWPWVYVPLVFQMMFPPGEWDHLRQDDNETIAQGEPLMHSCRAETVALAAENVNKEAAQALFYYAYSHCGRGLVDVQYVLSRAKSMASYYWERIVAVFLSLFIVAVVLMVVRRRKTTARGRHRRARYWMSPLYEMAARFFPSIRRTRGYKAVSRSEENDDKDATPLVPALAEGGATLPVAPVDDEEKSGSIEI